MPLTKSAGNMYPWVTHTHSHLRGACPHACPYCYVQAIERRFGGDHHTGPVRIADDELKVPYGKGRTIFIEHASDLFAFGIKPEHIEAILDHCRAWPSNTYVFQSKNPFRMESWIHYMPANRILGTTIESDITHVGSTPLLQSRAISMRRIPNVWPGTPTFITIEPVLRFTPRLAQWIIEAAPDFVNIGADSKHTPGLPEPTADELRVLIDTLTEARIEIRAKRNLDRLLNQTTTTKE